jgi:hypothetical protein
LRKTAKYLLIASSFRHLGTRVRYLTLVGLHTVKGFIVEAILTQTNKDIPSSL